MKNPLNRRFLRELKSELGKYIVIFVFLIVIIGFISGFLVTSGSLRVAYDAGFEKYNIEDGNFELYTEADEQLLEKFEAHGVTIYPNTYIEKETQDFDSTLRIFVNRTEVNKASLIKGAFPKEADEIAIDRMYADNNKISVGDELKVAGKVLKVTGLVALSDYNALFSSSSDMMFDAFKFGVAVMTEEGFESLGDSGIHYSYSWKYDKAPKDDIEAKAMSEEFLEVIAENAVVTNFMPMYCNQAIQFTDEDMGNDRIMFHAFLYIVIAIIAFVFAITTSNTIAKEATVIGTLRASGYSKGELICHYMALPMCVTLVAALVGNVLGYTVFKQVAVNIYYGNYSLPAFVTVWSGEAFVETTVIPVIIMFVINLVIIAGKMNLPPLKFIRRDLSKRAKKKALRLDKKISIMQRFRLRIIFQNVPNYVTIVVGIFFANIILILGMAFPALLKNYQKVISETILCNYQYVLKAQVNTETEGAESYCAGSLATIEGKLKSESVSLYGVNQDSRYIDLDFENGEVYISNAFAEKFDVSKGDTVTLKEEYGTKEYSFKVKDVYYYPSGIAMFMSRKFFNETFGNEPDYFNGYFSNNEITDIDERLIATKITEDDLNKMSRQLTTSMGGVFDMFFWIGLVIFVLVIYLLSKIVIEKNAQSISMTKILGYSNGEISNLYIMATSIVVVLAFILTMPLVNVLMKYVCEIMLSQFSGWLPYYIPSSAFAKVIMAGIVSYGVIVAMQFRNVKKIPLDIALKNVE